MSESILQELNKAKSDLALAEKNQILYKSVNAAIRSKKDVLEKLVKLGFTEPKAKELIEPDRFNRVGIPAYMLTNNNANIKRLKDRVLMLETKWKGANQTEVEEYEFDGGTFILNYDIDRVQIDYDSKPDNATLAKLKQNGWNWSPTNSAWQRKITPQAISNAIYLTRAVKKQNEPVEAVEIEQKADAFVTENPNFKGLEFQYKNQYELNKAIEAFLSEKGDNHADYTSDEKTFIRKYSGYGGLDQYGKTGKGGLFEYYTPKNIIAKMWALAYKNGYNNGPVLEPSVATGEFLQFAKQETRIVGYEISEFSAKICRILYPLAHIILQPFEQLFIKNNFTIKDKIEDLEKFDLVIGNPPYGDFSIVESRYMSGMGEKDFVKPRNYVEYFIRRGVDLLNENGLLIYIVGSQVKAGGIMFLDGPNTPVKEYLNDCCELLEAYRLPDSVFERTGVTSDIIVLKKIK
jgi:hypothetical protein